MDDNIPRGGGNPLTKNRNELWYYKTLGVTQCKSMLLGSDNNTRLHSYVRVVLSTVISHVADAVTDHNILTLTSHDPDFQADSIINSGYCSEEEKSTSTLHWDSCRLQSIHRSCHTTQHNTT